MPACTPELSLVIPTRNERNNVGALISRLEPLNTGVSMEAIFVDDSDDDTPAVVERHAAQSSLPIRVIHRGEQDRAGGLGGAVKAGLADARAPYVCVMDADLQHPPEVLADLVETAQGARADVVVATRYTAGGDVGDFGPARRLMSRASTAAARVLFPKRLRGVTDPMSGFFLVRRGAVDVDGLRPRGFKILLEILVGTAGLVIREVPFSFGARHAGDSKASLTEVWRYVLRLLELRMTPKLRRLVGFAAVGASGVAVNTAALAVLVVYLHLWYVLASIAATQVAIVSNYALSELIVFRHAPAARSRRFRMASYVAVNNGTLLLSGPLLVILVSGLGVGLLTANVITLLALVGIRFAVSDAYIWGGRRPVSAQIAG